MVDAADSKSAVLRDVLVRARPGAPNMQNIIFRTMSISKKIVLSLVALLSLTACENKKEEKPAEEKTAPATTTESNEAKPAENNTNKQ